jgi:hypothetical protein
MIAPAAHPSIKFLITIDSWCQWRAAAVRHQVFSVLCDLLRAYCSSTVKRRILLGELVAVLAIIGTSSSKLQVFILFILLSVPSQLGR